MLEATLMARFSAPEAVAFQNLRAICYQDLPAMELLERVAEWLERLIGADASCSHELDLTTALPTRAVMRGWPEAAMPLLIEHVLLVSRAADAAELIRSGRRVNSVEELVSASDAPDRDPYYTHHLLPFGYQHEVQVLCSDRGEAHGVVALTRKAAGGQFEPRHQRFLAGLAPHIGAGLARARVREALTSPRGAEIGMMVIDQSGRIELTNQVAEQWLAADVSNYWPYGLNLLATHLARRDVAEDSARFAEVELTHPGTGGRYRLHREHRPGADGARRTVLLLEPLRAGDQPALLRRLGLTPREVEVTVAVLRGLALKEIALRLRCSPHTATQHLKSVFLKLDVSSRSELAARLMGAAEV
jgi:DNA-binding CsgD family transcriptional regulator